MPITTEYKCDRCTKVVKDGEKMRTVGVVVVPLRTPHIQGRTLDKNQVWCNECLVQTGMINPSFDKDTEPDETPITLEELIREIAREEAEDVASSM